MTVLVIGGAGFVGLNVVERLLLDGRAVRVLDAGSPPEAALRHFATLPGPLSVETGDVRDAAAVARAVRGADRVVFGAAITSGPEREARTPGDVLDVNLRAFVTVLEAARAAGAGRVVNLSSAAAYGAAARGTEPVPETRPADPESLYAITKLASERVGRRLAGLWGLDVVSARLSAVFGRWERRTGVRDTPSPPSLVMEAAAAGTREIVLAGDDRRDWTYGPDVGRAVVGLLDAPALAHDLYNVSTGRIFGVLDWARAFAAARGDGLPVRLAGSGETATIAPSAPSRGPLAIDRLVADTGFAPAFDLASSARDAAEWSRLGEAR